MPRHILRRTQRAALFTGGGHLDPRSLPGLELYLDASLESGYANGADVTTPTNYGGNGTFTNATAAEKPHYTTGAFGGLAGFDFEATDSQSWGCADMSVVSEDRTHIAVINPESVAAEAYLFDTQNNRFIVYHAAGGNWFYYDSVGARDSGTAAATGAQIITTVVTAGGTGAMYKNLTQIGSGMTYTPSGAGNGVAGSSAVGSNFALDNGFFDGLYPVSLYYGAALSDSSRIALVSSLMARFGIS